MFTKEKDSPNVRNYKNETSHFKININIVLNREGCLNYISYIRYTLHILLLVTNLSTKHAFTHARNIGIWKGDDLCEIRAKVDFTQGVVYSQTQFPYEIIVSVKKNQHISESLSELYRKLYRYVVDLNMFWF